MRELPILFSTEMVRAILDGRKTMTRRVVKPQGIKCYKGAYSCPCTGGYALNMAANSLYCSECGNIIEYSFEGKDYCRTINAPYQPGDRLYVRETWCNEWQDPDGWTGNYLYRADGIEVADVDGGLSKSPWRPSIHMPKAAARIWLEVTGVRVERLQDMKLSDVYAEGIVSKPSPYKEALNPWKLFVNLWDDIAYKNDKTRFKTECGKYMWNADPWVWVIEFKRLEAEAARDYREHEYLASTDKWHEVIDRLDKSLDALEAVTPCT